MFHSLNILDASGGMTMWSSRTKLAAKPRLPSASSMTPSEMTSIGNSCKNTWSNSAVQVRPWGWLKKLIGNPSCIISWHCGGLNFRSQLVLRVSIWSWKWMHHSKSGWFLEHYFAYGVKCWVNCCAVTLLIIGDWYFLSDNWSSFF